MPLSFLIYILILFSSSFKVLAIFWSTSSKEGCFNGGVAKNINIKNDCYCQGTRFWGPRCQYSCAIKLHFNPHVPEKCLNGQCDDKFYVSCIDVRFNNFNVTRNKAPYPLCTKIPQTCINEQNVFFIERTINEKIVKCENNGILKYNTPNSTCVCLGTHYWGDFCEKPCTEFGLEIPESCLIKNGTCNLPKSCVDLSRPNILINRCKNGVFLYNKYFGRCSCVASGYFGMFCEKRCPVVKSLYIRNNTESLNFPTDYPVDCIFR